jgi:hypothetical protein
MAYTLRVQINNDDDDDDNDDDNNNNNIAALTPLNITTRVSA